MTMNVSLTPQLAEKVKKRVETGEYASVSEVVRAALRLLDQEERAREIHFQELKEKVLEGVKQVEMGQVIPFTEDLIEDIKKRGRERLKKRTK